MTKREIEELKRVQGMLSCDYPDEVCDPEKFDPDIGYTGYCKSCKARLRLAYLVQESEAVGTFGVI